MMTSTSHPFRQRGLAWVLALALSLALTQATHAAEYPPSHFTDTSGWGKNIQRTMRLLATSTAETEEYRAAVHKAARQNIEVSLSWHTLAVWTEEGKERIGYFARALDCSRAETADDPPRTPKEKWAAVHMKADCLFEIGRVHFHERAPEVARRFLTEALPLTQQADALQATAEVTDDRLEGRIAELLLQSPEENEA
jgi:hypothetical protein